MSQVDFAEKLEISRSHLCDIEKGRKSVSSAKASEMAKRLGYSPAQFIRLALQDELSRSGLKFRVAIEAA